MLRAIAIDDEPIALDVIRSLVTKISFVQLEQYFTNAFEAIDYLKQHPVDLIFLDIKMPDISGIEMLHALSNPPMVIFTTAYSEHAVQSFELNAIDYLLKPFSQARFLKACNKAQEQFELRSRSVNPVAPLTHIFIKSGHDQVRIDLNDILYIESNGNYMEFIMPDRKILSRLTMKEVEELLPSSSFVRIHRSYIVAKQQVNKIEKNAVWIRKTELPIGPGYAEIADRLTKA
jgi:DNA-binding LytR/AlgR family response regulator